MHFPVNCGLTHFTPSTMSEYFEAQQAAADGLRELGIRATLMVHCPSKLNTPEGVLLTTYDQLHSQLDKSETTACAFPLSEQLKV